jgi:Tfp pilus assembly protein PilN
MDEINLIPRDVLERRQRLSRYRLWSAVFAVVLILLPASALLLYRQVAVATQRVASLRQQHTSLAQRLDQLNVLQERQQQLSAREQIIDSLFTRVPLQQLFFDMATLTDAQLWLTKIDVRKTSEPLAGRASTPPAPARSTAFFTLGRSTTRSTTSSIPPTQGQGTATVLMVQGYTLSTQRLADFMASLGTVRYLTKVNLHVARRGLFLNSEAIEFVIELQT